MKVLLEGKKYRQSWDLVTNGRFVENIAIEAGAKDSVFGSFNYFRRWVIFQGNYDLLTDYGKLVFDLTDKLKSDEAVEKELERLEKENVSKTDL